MVTESNEQCGGEFLAQGSHSLRAAFPLCAVQGERRKKKMKRCVGPEITGQAWQLGDVAGDAPCLFGDLSIARIGVSVNIGESLSIRVHNFESSRLGPQGSMVVGSAHWQS